MGKLKLNFYWEEPRSAKGDELRATWARLSIKYDEIYITEVFNSTLKSINTDIYLPLYPLAEWIATNWWFITSEIFVPLKNDHSEYQKRHNIFYGREGYSLPYLSILPTGSCAEISWKQQKPKFQNTEFLNSGKGIVDLEDLKLELSNFVEQVIARLVDYKITGTFLQEEWEAVTNADEDEIQFCKYVASIGQDPYSIDSKQENAILKVYDLLPRSIVDEFFNIAHINKLLEEAKSVLKLIDIVKTNTFQLDFLKDIRTRIRKSKIKDSSPWEVGYHAAHRLRRILEIKTYELGKLSNEDIILSSCSKSSNMYSNKNIVIPSTINAIWAYSNINTPCLYLGDFKSDNSRRFIFYRTLYEYLFSKNEDVFLITTSHSDKQKINRAFAAEFLVPAERLRTEIKYKVITDEEIDELAEKLNVSSMIIRHQIVNHEIAFIDSY